VTLIPDLQLQLRDAAADRRRRATRRGLGSVAAAFVAVAALVALPVLSDDNRREGDHGRQPGGEQRPEGALPVGTVIPKGQGTPPRDARSTVVATGTAPVAGPWQLEVWRNHGGPSPPGERRGRCLFIGLLDPPGGDPTGLTGYCGGLGFRRTPGFSRAQKNVEALRRQPDGSFELTRAAEVLVYGRVPERARQVVITAEGGLTINVEPSEGPKSIPGDFFVIPVKPGLGHARINWIDENGKPGSRGIRLMPPITSS
jgi:hypothetical protein